MKKIEIGDNAAWLLGFAMVLVFLVIMAILGK